MLNLWVYLISVPLFWPVYCLPLGYEKVNPPGVSKWSFPIPCPPLNSRSNSSQPTSSGCKECTKADAATYLIGCEQRSVKGFPPVNGESGTGHLHPPARRGECGLWEMLRGLLRRKPGLPGRYSKTLCNLGHYANWLILRRHQNSTPQNVHAEHSCLIFIFAALTIAQAPNSATFSAHTELLIHTQRSWHGCQHSRASSESEAVRGMEPWMLATLLEGLMGGWVDFPNHGDVQ